MIIQLENSIMPELNISFDTEAKNLKIIDSYMVQNKSVQKSILQEINEQLQGFNITFNRTLISQLNEWAAHNVLYGWGIQPSSTQSVDIDEGETALRKFGYFVLAQFAKK